MTEKTPHEQLVECVADVIPHLGDVSAEEGAEWVINTIVDSGLLNTLTATGNGPLGRYYALAEQTVSPVRHQIALIETLGLVQQNIRKLFTGES